MTEGLRQRLGVAMTADTLRVQRLCAGKQRGKCRRQNYDNQ
jgi:hypothetical protein